VAVFANGGLIKKMGAAGSKIFVFHSEGRWGGGEGARGIESARDMARERMLREMEEN